MIFRNANDFCFDNQYLSDYGFIIAEFGAIDTETINQGSDIVLSTVPINHGSKYLKSASSYEGVITSEFRIIKSPESDNYVITDDEYRDIVRWLNRKDYCTLHFISDSDEETVTCFYDATFNVSQVYDNLRRLVALDLSMTTNRPFGYGQMQSSKMTFSGNGEERKLTDISDEIGLTVPDMQIKINRSGDLTLENITTESALVIKNCIYGETITINGDMKIISTDSAEHRETIANDFNYEFVTIGNTIDNRFNRFIASIPCEVTISYHPVVK